MTINVPSTTSTTDTDKSPPPTPSSPAAHPARDPTPALEPPPNPDSDDKPPNDSGHNGTIDLETFAQIIDLDEDDTHDFSKGMAWAYFAQAAQTFDDMDAAYAKKDLEKLSSLGHFLKGSSAALGVAKVQASCERIQHYGGLRDEEVHSDLSDTEALAKIDVTLKRVKVEYAEAEKWLKDYYKNLVPAAEPSASSA